MNLEMMKGIAYRVVATFLATGLGVVGAGTIAGVGLVKSIWMAGIGGMATVVEGLSRAYLKDGSLDQSEINAVFDKVDGEEE